MYFVLYFLFFVFLSKTALPKEVKQTSCKSTSACIFLENCSPFMDVIEKMGQPMHPSFHKFLKTKSCGFEDEKPKVCCSKISHKERFFVNTKEIILKKPTACKFPLKCVNLEKCDIFKNLLEALDEPISPYMSRFLNSQQCGFTSVYPLICCPKSDASDENNEETTIIIEKRQEENISLKDTSESMMSKIFSINIFDYMDFDLFRSKRSHLNDQDEVEIEIR